MSIVLGDHDPTQAEADVVFRYRLTDWLGEEISCGNFSISYRANGRGLQHLRRRRKHTIFIEVQT